MRHFVELTLCRGKRSAPSVHRSPATKTTDRPTQQTDQQTQAGTTPAPAKNCGKRGGCYTDTGRLNVGWKQSSAARIWSGGLSWHRTPRNDANWGRHCKGAERESQWWEGDGRKRGKKGERSQRAMRASTQSIKAGEIREREKG